MPLIQDVGSDYIGKLMTLDSPDRQEERDNTEGPPGSLQVHTVRCRDQAGGGQGQRARGLPVMQEARAQAGERGVGVHEPAEDSSAGPAREAQGQHAHVAARGLDDGRHGQLRDAWRPSRHNRHTQDKAEEELEGQAGEGALHYVPRRSFDNAEAEGVQRARDTPDEEKEIKELAKDPAHLREHRAFARALDIRVRGDQEGDGAAALRRHSRRRSSSTEA